MCAEPANDSAPIPPSELVWAVCRYMAYRDPAQPCRRCPAWEHDDKHGFVGRACYAMAREVVNIVQTGNAWRTS